MARELSAPHAPDNSIAAPNKQSQSETASCPNASSAAPSDDRIARTACRISDTEPAFDQAISPQPPPDSPQSITRQKPPAMALQAQEAADNVDKDRDLQKRISCSFS